MGLNVLWSFLFQEKQLREEERKVAQESDQENRGKNGTGGKPSKDKKLLNTLKLIGG